VYTATSDASKEKIWLRKLFSGLFGDKIETTVVHCDNPSCIKLTDNPVFHDRSKHIDMRYHYIQDLVQRKTLKLQYISTSEQVAGICWAQDMIIFMMVIIHFRRMYIYVLYVLKEIFEEFYDKMV
jgi:hypothetical protein